MATNVPNGKLYRGLSVPKTGTICLERELSEKEPRDMSILGWFVEMLQANLLILDDIMDEPTTRRGQPCWYKCHGVGLTAINDVSIIKSAIFLLLKKHFPHLSSYLNMVESFQEIALLTESGQENDELVTREPDPQKWILEHYENITDIIEDFRQSEKGIANLVRVRKKKMREFLSSQGVSAHPNALDMHFSTVPEDICTFLIRFRHVHGSGELYLRSIGFTQEDVITIQNNLLSDI